MMQEGRNPNISGGHRMSSSGMANILRPSASVILFMLAHFSIPLEASPSQSQQHHRQLSYGACLPEKPLQKKTFLSHDFTLGPGDVQDKFYLMEFPTGHIALRSFFAEVVDDEGVSVPLYDVYLHHWVVVNIYVKQSEKEEIFKSGDFRRNKSNAESVIWLGNDGVCAHKTLSQFFGLGSETRHTNTTIPAPYGIVVGDPQKVPEGYEEVWIVNIHAIDTRGVEDPQGCLECRCDLYNVTPQGHDGQPLANYPGGLRCCTDGTHCRLKEGLKRAEKKKLYLRYTVEWVEMNECVVPTKTYIFDVTATKDECKVEYNTPICPSFGLLRECMHTQESHQMSPLSGQVIYGVAHQHYGGRGLALYGEDGREICTSLPLYGSGTKAGDENGYVIGMSSCYPKPGSVRIEDKEVLKLQSNYSTREFHTGVMGLLYLMVVADEDVEMASKSLDFGLASNSRHTPYALIPPPVTESKDATRVIFGFALALGFASILALLVVKHMRKERMSSYEPLVS